jgi:hypothetical protein
VPTVVFTPAARKELIEAQDWYEQQATGLGRRFRDAVDFLVGRISASPVNSRSFSGMSAVLFSAASRMPCLLSSRAIP